MEVPVVYFSSCDSFKRPSGVTKTWLDSRAVINVKGMDGMNMIPQHMETNSRLCKGASLLNEQPQFSWNITCHKNPVKMITILHATHFIAT